MTPPNGPISTYGRNWQIVAAPTQPAEWVALYTYPSSAALSSQLPICEAALAPISTRAPGTARTSRYARLIVSPIAHGRGLPWAGCHGNRCLTTMADRARWDRRARRRKSSSAARSSASVSMNSSLNIGCMMSLPRQAADLAANVPTSHATVCHPLNAVLVSLPTPRSRQPARRCRLHHGYGAPPQWDTAISAEPVAILPGRTTPPTRHHQIFIPRPGPPSHLTRPDGDLPVGPSPRSELGDMHATESAADMLFCPLVFGDLISCQNDRKYSMAGSRKAGRS